MKGFRSSRMNTTYTQELVQIVAPVMQTATAKARATVLLAEDDRSLRRYLEVMLQRAGYNVIVAADGLEALKAALSSEVDAVVTDAVMPHLSGYELCRFLRRHPKLGRLPLVLLSGNDGQGEPDSNADAYLSKPVRAEELTGCVARLLSLAE